MTINLFPAGSTTTLRHLPAIFLIRHSLPGCFSSGKVKSGEKIADSTNPMVSGIGDSFCLRRNLSQKWSVYTTSKNPPRLFTSYYHNLVITKKAFREIKRFGIELFFDKVLQVHNPYSPEYAYGVWQTFVKNRYRRR